MPGPGGPTRNQRPAAANPSRPDAPSSLLKDQVLVAAFPEGSPEVHVASLDTDRGILLLREATIQGGGSVSLGGERTVALADVASVDVADGAVALLGRVGQLLVQLHLETPEDQRNWAEGLRAVVSTTTGAPEDTDDADAHMLQARSRQLQNKIGTLEAISDRRDAQLEKMLGRLDGAMQMMSAVQEMCSQQKKVIDAQKVAIVELTDECGGGDADIPSEGFGTHNQAASRQESYDVRGHEDEDAPDNSESAAQVNQMMALLQQADEMQRALRELEGPTGAAATPAGSAAVSNGPLAGSMAQGHIGHVDDAEDCEEGNTEEALNRLRSLEEEKERYEGMLQASQKEHVDLLSKLNDMRSLMSSLGMEEPEGSDSDAEE